MLRTHKVKLLALIINLATLCEVGGGRRAHTPRIVSLFYQTIWVYNHCTIMYSLDLKTLSFDLKSCFSKYFPTIHFIFGILKNILIQIKSTNLLEIFFSEVDLCFET